MAQIEVEYRGFRIWYLEGGNEWGCILREGKELKKEGLAQVKESIDKFLKKEENFQRFDVYWLGYHYGSKASVGTYTVTSITSDGDYWTVDNKGNRRKCRPNEIYKLTPENKALLDEYEELSKTVRSANLRQDDIKKLLEDFNEK